MRAVRDEALDEAGEGIQDTGDAAAVQAEAVGDVLGDTADGDDGNGIVCRAKVGEADERSDAKLGASPLTAD